MATVYIPDKYAFMLVRNNPGTLVSIVEDIIKEKINKEGWDNHK